MEARDRARKGSMPRLAKLVDELVVAVAMAITQLSDVVICCFPKGRGWVGWRRQGQTWE